MKKRIFIIAPVALVGIICVVAFLVFVSLWGENNKIDEAANAFFEGAKKKQYDTICSDLNQESLSSLVPASGECSDAIFLLELSLLRQFNLLDSPDYVVVARKSHFWIPYYRDGAVSISVSLKGQEKYSAEDKLSLQYLLTVVKGYFVKYQGNETFINRLLVAKRDRGIWKITAVNMKGSALSLIYADLKKHMDQPGPIRETEDGFAIRRLADGVSDMDPADRRILNHKLQKMETLIGSR